MPPTGATGLASVAPPAGASMDTFAVVAEPTRRRILDRLRGTESSVGDLVGALAVSQPTVSKHLRVLRDAGLVTCRVAAQQRIYRVEPAPLRALDDWLAPYRRMWDHHLEALERYLDEADDTAGTADTGPTAATDD